MTREEAINELRYAKAMCEFDPNTGKLGFRNDEDKRQYEALSMALEEMSEPQIIRCMECKHAQWDAFWGCYWCNGKQRTGDWFCADAERRIVDNVL